VGVNAEEVEEEKKRTTKLIRENEEKGAYKEIREKRDSE
jgi:hypothetical protein